MADDDHGARIAREMIRAATACLRGRDSWSARRAAAGRARRTAPRRARRACASRRRIPSTGAAARRRRSRGPARIDGRARGRRMRADVGEPRLDLGDAVRVVRGLGLGEQARALGVGGEHDLDQAFRAARRFLRQPADARARRHARSSPCSSGELAGDGAEQRGLADAVAADEPDARAVRDARGGAVEQQAAGNADREVVENEHARVLWPAARGLASATSLRCAVAAMLRDPGADRATEQGGRSCAFPDARRRCIARCRGAGFSGARRPRAAAASPRPRSTPRAAPQRSFKSVVDLTHTMSPEFPTFFGVPGIEIEKQFDFKKDGFNLNWWQHHRACRHASRRADPFLGERRDGREDPGRATGGAARGDRRARPRPRRTPTTR